ncbi:MAG: hypothetical protein V1649_02585 [Patescibacteria group bacterium]
MQDANIKGFIVTHNDYVKYQHVAIRLNGKDAKDIYELTELNMPVLVIDKEKDYYEPANKNFSEFPEVSAKRRS